MENEGEQAQPAVPGSTCEVPARLGMEGGERARARERESERERWRESESDREHARESSPPWGGRKRGKEGERERKT